MFDPKEVLGWSSFRSRPILENQKLPKSSKIDLLFPLDRLDQLPIATDSEEPDGPGSAEGKKSNNFESFNFEEEKPDGAGAAESE